METQTQQVQQQTKIYTKGINKRYYFGEVIAPYLIRRFRRLIQFPLLDAGGGDGSVIRELHRQFPENRNDIRGLDLAAVPELGIEAGNLAAMLYSDQSFMTVTCTEVLEHLDDETLDGSLKEIYRVLRPGGSAIITFPFQEDLSKSTFTCPHCEHTFHRIGHVRTFDSEAQIEDLFQKYQFEIRKLEILPLGAVAKYPILRLLKGILNRLDNPPGLRKRAIVVLTRPA